MDQLLKQDAVRRGESGRRLQLQLLICFFPRLDHFPREF